MAAAHPDVVDALSERIEALLEAARSRPGAVVEEAVDPRVREQLEALGYVD